MKIPPQIPMIQLLRLQKATSDVLSNHHLINKLQGTFSNDPFIIDLREQLDSVNKELIVLNN